MWVKVLEVMAVKKYTQGLQEDLLEKDGESIFALQGGKNE
jgi:hypothetical protein